MGTYPIWRKAADRGDLKRLTFVCGSETVLVEEVVAETKAALGESEYYSFNMEEDDSADFFNTLYQYPLDEKPRLIVLRSSEKVQDWKPFYEWMEEGFLSMPKTHVLMISLASHLYLRENGEWLKGGDGKKVMREPAQSLGHRGRLVECNSLSGEELVKWARRFAPELDVQLAKYLISRVGGDLFLVKTAAMKLDLFKDLYLGKEAVDQVAEESVGDRFVDLLIRGKKYQAVLAVPSINISDYQRVISSLDHMLDVLTILNSELSRYITKREQQQIVGVSPWHAEMYGDICFAYDQHKVRSCRSVLAYLEDVLASGDQHVLEEEDGVLEALVALWN